MKLAAGKWRNGTWVRAIASCAARSLTRTGRDQHCEGSTNPKSAAEARERPGQAAITAPRGRRLQNHVTHSSETRGDEIRKGEPNHRHGCRRVRPTPQRDGPRGGSSRTERRGRHVLKGTRARGDLTSEAPESNCPTPGAAGGNRPGPVMRRRPATMRGSGAEASAATGDRDAGEKTHEGRKVASPASTADPIAGKANTPANARQPASPE